MPADGLNVARRVTPTRRWYGTGQGHRPPMERGPIWLGLAPARSAARPRASPDDPRPDVGDTRSHGGRRRGALRAPLEEEPRVIALPGTRTQASLHPRAVDRAALGRERRRRGAAIGAGGHSHAPTLRRRGSSQNNRRRDRADRWRGAARYGSAREAREATRLGRHDTADPRRLPRRLQDPRRVGVRRLAHRGRSEEHTSELQSQSNLVCRLLLEKKKKKKNEQFFLKKKKKKKKKN